MTPAELQTKFRAYCEERGLTLGDARRLGFRPLPLPPPEITFRRAPGFVIPYYGTNGKATGFYRYRFLPPLPQRKIKLKLEDVRYLQPEDSPPELYLPRLQKWTPVVEDAEQMLLITEGEGKAAAACKAGFACVGLGGIWNFRSQKQGWRLLPELKRWALRGRKIYVVVDSDAETNGNVRLAQNILCQELCALEADVYAFRVPKLGEAKTGLDDYLVASGPDALRGELKQTPQWAESVALSAMNKECLFVKDLSAILIPDRFYNRERFTFRHANRYYDVSKEVFNKKTQKSETKLIRKQTGTEWIKWPGRREAERTVFDPTAAPNVVSDLGLYNLYQGLAVAPQAGDVGPWLRLMDWIFPTGEEDARRWFTCWLAYPLQRIAEHANPKMHSAAVMISAEQGTGKGLVVAPVSAIYGVHARTIGQRELRSDFNEWARSRLLICGNEITGDECRQFADYLKILITEETVDIREMYTPRYSLENYINWYFTSNHADAFFLSFKDRRFFIHRAPERKLIEAADAGWGRKGIDAYVAWMKKPDAIAALLYYLLHVRLGTWDHRDPPETTAKLEQQMESANQAALWGRAAKDTPKQFLKTQKLEYHKDKDGKQKADWVPVDLSERWLWSAEELLKLSGLAAKNYTSRAMGAALREAGWFHALRGAQIRNLRGQPKVPLWSLYPDKVRELNERGLAKQYNEERAIQKSALP